MPERLQELEAVARRYAIRLTPRWPTSSSPTSADPIARQFVPDPRELILHSCRAPRPDRGLRQDSGQGARASLSRPGADEPPPFARSIAASAFAASVWVRARGRSARPTSPWRSICSRASSDLGGHTDWRLSVDAVAPPHRRGDPGAPGDPPRQGAALAYAPAGRRAGAGDESDGARSDRRRQDDGGRRARQPSARATEAARHACRRLAAEGAMLVSQSVLSEGRQRRRGDARRPDARLRRGAGEPYYLHLATSRPAPRIGACRSPKARN